MMHEHHSAMNNESDIVGFLEKVTRQEICGWVQSRSGAQIGLALSVNGKLLALDPIWNERSDVAPTMVGGPQKSGFVAPVAAGEAELLAVVVDDVDAPFEVLANGVALPKVAGFEYDAATVAEAPTALLPEPLPARPESPPAEAAQSASAREVPVAGDILGYVERIDPQEISGWALSRSGAPLHFAIELAGEARRIVARWTARLDVPVSVRGAEENIGFSLRMRSALAAAVQATLDAGGQLRVLANGLALERADGCAVSASRRAKLARAQPTGRVEKLTPFRVTGWCVDASGNPGRLTLLSNDESVECTVVRRARADVAAEMRLEDPEVGFEIDLPPSIWRNMEPDGSCQLELLVDDQPIPGRELLVTQELAATWIGQICKMEDGVERQFLMIAAVEHLRTGDFFDLIEENQVAEIEKFVKYMKLEDFLFAESGVKRKPEEPPRESGSTLLLWDAMRELNALMDGQHGKVLAHVKRILETRRLRGIARDWFLNLAVQLTCGSNEFLQLRELLDFAQIEKFEHSSEPHQLTLALPALVANDEIARATELVWRLSKLLFSGWLHTECVRYSLNLVQEKEAAGEIDPLAAERFRGAIIGLFAGFNAEWFGRLHDRELCDTMILTLAGLDRYTDQHRRDVVAAAIRLWGLNPTFWSRWQARPDRPFHPELARAEGHWMQLSDMLRAPVASIHERLQSAVKPLRYFREAGNPEVVIFLRELILASLPQCDAGLGEAGNELLEMLLAGSQGEAVRVAAFPGDGEHEHRRHLLQTDSELRYLVRKIGDRRRSPSYDLQIAAASAVLQCKDALAQADSARMEAALKELEATAILLSGSHAAYIGVDLFATVYLLAAESVIDGTWYLVRMMECVRRICDPASGEATLPVAVQTAMQALYTLPKASPARRFIDEMMSMVRGRFGDSYDALFEPDEEDGIEQPKQLTLAARGYPHDTLVMIYSCRKNLDSRLRAIRETWLPDLVAAGIPYLVVVGDGDNSVTGDVLSLAVGDGLEHTAAKTLRMFEWAYRRTDAQFVVKVEDDCYLDVARYFDTLSYRKHAYYGRVVERKPGDTKRLIPLNGEGDADGPVAIDRSPEPSTFADGRGGYCLSRQAMLKLIEAQEDGAGQRLIGVSFYEDKLVGDLLASKEILPSDEDSDGYQQRELVPGGIPVCAGEDHTFFPGPLTPTKIVHMGAAVGRDGMAEADGLYPKKIWPTCWAPTIAVNGSQLQLLSPQQKHAELLRNDAIVVAVVRNEKTMMPHFLEHYRGLGLRCFIIVDNCSTDGTREYLAAQPDVVLYSTDTEYKYSHYGVSWQQAVLGSHCLGKWVILADADELLVYEGSESIPFATLLQGFEAEGATGALTYMVDMYPYGDLDDACFSAGKPFDVAPYFEREPLIELRFGGGQYSNSRNFVNGLRHRVAPSRINAYVSQKYAVFKYFPWVRLSEGVHYAANLQVSATPAFFAHFKYHSGFKKKVSDEIKRNQHFNGAEEYRRYAAMLAEGAGGFGSEQTSIRYGSSRDFVRLVQAHTHTEETSNAA